MPIIRSEEDEREGLMQVSKLMLVSARTALKSGGVNDILTTEMGNITEERKINGFKRDAKNMKDSEAVVLIGVRGTKKFGLNCGACGYANCYKFEKAEKRAGQDFTGATCIFKALDLGIALESAVKTASIPNVDNRIMYQIGAAARRLNLLPEASVIMGIPVSAKGKNIYFDRKV